MYDDYDLDGPRTARWLGLTVVLGVVAAFGFMMLRDQQDRTSRADALSIDTAAAAVPTTTTAPTTTAPTTTAPATEPDATAPTVSVPAPTTTAPAAPITAPDASPPADTAPETTTATRSDLGYPATPDGRPLPVIVTYDTGSVKLTGFVPSEESRNRLVGLAVANSQTPDPDVVDNLIVNPAVPASVGVRVIEMNSARFGEGEAQLTPEHTVQFDRVGAVLDALPHVTVLVIGHADQRGDEERNRELSEGRANAVVDYLTYLGIEPARISMRGAGETDLLTLDDDAAALALNRRTEFVFYGVLL